MCSVSGTTTVLEEGRTRHPFAVVLGAREGLLALSVCREQPSTPTVEALGCTWRSREVWNASAVYMVPPHNCCFGGVSRTFGVPWEKLGKHVQEHGWLVDLEPWEVLWSELIRYWGRTVESVASSSPCELSTVLHWRTAIRVLTELPEEQRSQFSGVSLVHGPPRRPTHVWVVDGHCHLELLKQWVSIYATVENTVLYFMHEHRSSVIEGLEAVLSNQVIHAGWEAHIPGVIGGVCVVRMWGAHPKALDNVDWKWLEGRMSSAECVIIGECGLDETGPNMAHQEVAFKR